MLRTLHLPLKPCFRGISSLGVACLAVAIFTARSASAEEARVRFGIDVVQVLTKHGCNSGGCHGKAVGRGGFKLSLWGFDPAADHAALVQQARGRRIFPAAPDQSLLLLKGSGSVPHGGGRRLNQDSEDYRLLRAWIQQGAPPVQAEDPTVDRISVQPGQEMLQPGETRQLTVTAYLTDGSSSDVTAQAAYDSNDPELVQVDADGLVSGGSSGGLFSIMVRYGGQVGSFFGTIPFSPTASAPQSDAGEPTLAELESSLSADGIDRHLAAQWKRLGIRPSKVVDEATFIRRATLDICGTLPTAEEVTAYVQDSRPDKRAQLIDRLLQRPEHASYFALKWADILQNRGRGYSTRRQREGTALFTGWIRDAIAMNKPYDQFASEIITATGSQAENPPTVWYRSVRTQTDYVESISQAFLGVRIQCAQCHHHPTEQWSQGDYYSLAAVFARVGRKGGFSDAEVPTSQVIYLKDESPVKHPRTGRTMRPRPLGGPDFELSHYDDPRRALAQWMTSEDNPYFARTMANRMWGHFMDRGIIHPIDDARSTNPPSNPELLQALAQDFIASGYDVRRLIRVICNSYAYRLSSTPGETNAQDTQSFSRFYPRRLSAEVLLDAYSQVLGVPTKFPGGVGEFPLGTRAIELPDENVALHFLDVFGRPARESACECEREDSASLAQALELVNSSEIQRKLSSPEGYVQQLAERETSHDQNVREIFLRAFARPPTQQELRTSVDFLKAEPDLAAAYRSLLWSLLATNEFMFNF